MNKKIWFLLVVALSPSFAFADKIVFCEYVNDQLDKGKTSAEIYTSISAMTERQINMSGVNQPEAIIEKAAQAKAGAASGAFNVTGICENEVYDRLAGPRRQRNGNQKRSGNTQGVVGAGMGGVAAGAAIVASMDANPESRNLRSTAESVPELIHEEEEKDHTGLTKCTALEDTMCAVPDASRNFADFAVKLAISMDKELAHCGCIEGKAKALNPNKTERDKIIAQKNEQMKNMVMESFSKKFINDYAAHLEDMRFYSATASGVFGEDKASQDKTAASMICSTPADFRAAALEKCALKFTDKQFNERLDKLFAPMGEKADGYEYFAKLNGRIMVNTDDDGSKYSREDFDKARKGITDDDKNFKFIDNLVASLMRNDRTREIILKKKPIPMEGILQFVTEQIRRNDKFLMGFLNKQILGDEIYNEMATKFQDTEIAVDVLREKLNWAKRVHPGFESLMKRPDIFDQTGKKMQRNAKSAIEVLDTDETILKPDLVARCTELKENFAKFICTPESEIVKSVPKNELREVVEHSGLNEDFLYHDLAICKTASNEDSKGPFSELHITATSRHSDILERLSKKPKKEQDNLFTKMMLEGKSGDPATQQWIADVTRRGISSSSGLSNDSFGRQYAVSDSERISFGSKVSSFDKSIVEATAFKDEKFNPTTTTQNAIPFQEPNPQTVTNFTPNYSVAAASPAPQENQVTKPGSNEKADLRNDLREFLSNKENQENVDRLMKGADDKQLAELARLREESDRRKEQILQLTTENEKLKLKQMQDELAALEEKRAKAVATNVNAPETQDEEPKSSGRGSREIASIGGDSSGASTSGVSGSRGGPSTSGSSSVGSSDGATGGKASGLSGLRNELANLTGNETTTSGSSEAVVISSAQARSGAIEIKSNELSNEIMSFLESEPDVQTLIKMRKSGMIYQYKVLENGKEVTKEIAVDYKTLSEDVKKLIDQKIADSGRAGSEAQRLSAEIRNLRRAYTYNSLKVILGEQIKKKQ